MQQRFFSVYLAAPVIMVIGGYCLVRCVAALWKIIMPDVRHRFAADGRPRTVSLPRPGRYVVSIVIPPLTFVPGTAYFSADFSVKASATGDAVKYNSSRWSLLNVRRTDLGGNTAQPVGTFECAEPGNYEITCLTPDKVRSNFQIEVSPYVAPLRLVVPVLGAIVTSAMTIGGLIVSLLWMAGRL